MKYIDEYRQIDQVKRLADKISGAVSRPWTIMEICGGQTHAILRFGVDELLPDEITLVHGPGCPVCVTAVETVDKAIRIAGLEDVIFCSFGDMLRVPGTEKDLQQVKAEGGDVRTVYSPLDALKSAMANRERKVVFFAVGFETTAPATAMAVYQAKRNGVKNFSLLTAHVLVPPAIDSILSMPGTTVQGFLLAGHVCTVTGYQDYIPLADKFRVPMVVTGFEPVDLMQGIYMCVRQLERGDHSVQNQYSRTVKPEGNIEAQGIIDEVFEVCDRKWRGIGTIPSSGWKLNADYADLDAENIFKIGDFKVEESSECISGIILQGMKKPVECEVFGTKCNPEHPLGATMVSSEGACAAYFKYRKR